MTSKYEIAVDSLLETETLPPKDILVELSDLDQAEIQHLRGKWDEISKTLLRSLIEELRKQADENIALSFEQINRLALEDDDDEVRRSSILSLWESENPSLVIPFVEKLNDDPSDDVRAAAASALGAFVLLGETPGLPQDRLKLIEDALLDVYQTTENGLLHRNCLDSLGYSSREEVNELILTAFESDDETLVRSSIIAMGRSANQRWKDFVLTHLLSPSPLLRLASVVAVGELEVKEALEEILELIDDVDIKIRNASVWSLSQIGGSRAADILAELFNAAEDGEELQLLEDAFDNLAFIDGTRDMLVFDHDDEEESAS